jgi:uncharacterized repeat protein (TIGR01451 family)
MKSKEERNEFGLIIRRFGILIAFLLALTAISVAQPELTVVKNATNTSTGDEVSIISPGDIFSYNITINNTGDANATQVVVTDKLDPNVEYISVNQTGGSVVVEPTANPKTDLVVVQFQSIPPDTEKVVGITVRAPTDDSPYILYNHVLVRATNISANIFAENKTIVMPTYERFNATKSFENLLKSQAHLLLSFEDLLHMTDIEGNETKFIQSFEQLLDTQGDLLLSFEELLHESPDLNGWYTEFTPEERIDFLLSFEELLKKEAYLFNSFENVLKTNWYAPDVTDTDRQEFVASFEKLLHKEMTLFSSYETLFKDLRLDPEVSDYPVPEGYGLPATMTADDLNVTFLSSFETLLRLQGNLLMSFEDVVKLWLNPPTNPISSVSTIQLINETTPIGENDVLTNATSEVPTNDTNRLPTNATSTT